MAMREKLDVLLVDQKATKQDVAEYLKGILKNAKENYESKLAELDERYRKQAAQPSAPSHSARITELGRNITTLTIEIFVVKSWKDEPCKYCEALLENNDSEASMKYMKEIFPLELGVDKKNYSVEIIPCDWNYMEATPNDNAYYKNIITEEGLNYLWMCSLEISGFPSLRISATDRNSTKYEQIIDGLGRHTESGWSFGIKQILLAFLEQTEQSRPSQIPRMNRSLRDTIEDHTHRRQDDGQLKQNIH